MSSGDFRGYGLHGEVLGDDCSGGSSDSRNVHRDVVPEPPAEVPGTRLSGSVASSGLSSDASREHRDREASWRPYSWGDHDSWGDSEWGGQWASHSDTSWRRWQWRCEQDDSRGGRDRHHHARPERHRESRDSPEDREAPKADGRDRIPRRHDSDDRRGAGKKGVEDGSTTSAEDEPFKRQSDGRPHKTNLLLNAILGRDIVERPVLETQYGKGGNTSAMPTRATSTEDARAQALEVATAPPRGLPSLPSTARTVEMTWGPRRGHTFGKWKHGGG